ncbi:MAG: diaminopropionate ammonia-lyase [Vicinamibacterales bacterium]
MTSVFVAARSGLPAAPSSSLGLFSADEYALVTRFFDSHPGLAPTPLTPLPALARRLGLGTLLAKDETHRFGLNAFKLLGARFAVEQLLADGAIRPGDTLVCASEGNHGRAVAHTARAVGCPARVYLSESVAAPRADAIAGEGATVVRVAGTYDDAVRQAAADAGAHGWTVVSDTSWPGYERIPRLIMLGYTRMMDEMIQGMPDDWRPDAIFVPGGVGGLLAAVASWSAFHFPRPPHIVAVEPSSCACLQVSARAGTPSTVAGPFTTMMGGLRCGEVSPLAFEGALPIVDGYVAVDDAWAERAMRLLSRPADEDPAIEAGPSGAAALAGLLATREDPAARELALYLDLGSWSTVVVIVSEGMTDPPLWQRVMAATA